jgi:tetratricopeptide (TPR) repeat protein
MYLPLAAVVIAAVIGGHELIGRLSRRLDWSAIGRRRAQAAVVAVLVTLLGATTYARNEVYQNDLVFWSDVVAKAPLNGRGHYGLALAYEDRGRFDEAVAHYRRAIELNPKDKVSHNNLANRLAETAPGEALLLYKTALKIDPDYADARSNVARLLARYGQTAEAIKHCRKAIQLRPKSAQPRLNLANLLAESQPDEAIRNYRQALAVKPDFAEAHFHLANTLVLSGRISEGVAHLQEALRLQPEWPEARKNLAILLELPEQ